MNYFEEIKSELLKFKNLGIENSKDGAILIGKAPHNGPEGWLNIIYPVLSKDELISLEKELKMLIPDVYSEFLMNFSNGLNILSSTFSLYGLRRQINRLEGGKIRQPYSIITPNLYERPDNSNDNFFFIGGYNWDGSHLYIDKETGFIHCCERWDATSKIQWESLEGMILSELKRLYLLFDNNGVELDEDIETTPYS
ncbi:1,3-beta-glucan synthase regulator [Flavobacterium aquidurense]|uniref:SMI1/KNR4 family protein n=1 Tax=Flavobacterium aquidurense TaxID=362413 RepID=UPI00091E91D8|nr:SMI1/KNR4 family protein [Flavobacterium aquidurense]OXA71216.1 1,3-beta-glucan synthase regulator [Flavobacterium aquidurense]SHG68613.1 SMI1-KNR4 cell-wall [Flavobacterium frigidimaris]